MENISFQNPDNENVSTKRNQSSCRHCDANRQSMLLLKEQLRRYKGLNKKIIYTSALIKELSSRRKICTETEKKNEFLTNEIYEISKKYEKAMILIQKLKKENSELRYLNGEIGSDELNSALLKIPFIEDELSPDSDKRMLQTENKCLLARIHELIKVLSVYNKELENNRKLLLLGDDEKEDQDFNLKKRRHINRNYLRFLRKYTSMHPKARKKSELSRKRKNETNANEDDMAL